ncbi:MAG: cation:proton antiporter [Fidelibacterota bacterium]
MPKSLWKIISRTFFFLLIPVILFAEVSGISHSMMHKMELLVLQLGVIIFVAKGMSILFEKIKIPGVVGELTAGIIIGPYLLGGIPLPGFEHGFFGTYLALNPGATLPVSPELYGIATIASVLLLFMVGLETNFSLFLRLSATGVIVGIAGVIVSFLLGAWTGMLLLDLPFLHPETLFLGVISTATSVGITGRILTERRKMDTPEGVTILAAAVIDDVLGIVLLAVILGMIPVLNDSGQTVNWGHVLRLGAEAIGVWLLFTILGLVLSKRISNFLKIFKGINVPAIMAFGLALLLAGIFEKAGLAMIIGAYVMGLSLSKTDLNYVIQESLKSLYLFAVPVFFVVSGMMVDLSVFSSRTIIFLGLVYTLGAILAKVFGCGIPLLFRKFNLLGALRVGFGMAPRAEVALIIAGIGLSAGLLSRDVFGMVIFMSMLTTVSTPPILDSLFKKEKMGTTEELLPSESVVTEFSLPTLETVEFVSAKSLQLFRDEGFFINQMEMGHKYYHIRKNDISITMICKPNGIYFESSPNDTHYVKTLMYESFVELNEIINDLKDITKPESLKNDFMEGKDDKRVDLRRVLDPGCIRLNLRGSSKKEIIEELVDILDSQYQITDKKKVFEAVWEREQSFSTGMKNGLAIPHARTDYVGSITLAVGIHRKGVNFESLDGEPSRVFVLLLSPKHKTVPHIQILAHIAAVMSKEDAVRKILDCKTPQAVYQFLTESEG